MRILLKNLLTFTLITGASQLSAKETIKGSTLGNYAKPGADIGIEYMSQKVNVLESATVQINLIPNTRYRTLDVQISMDETLQNLSDTPKKMHIEVKKKQKKYPIEIEVSAQTEGVYYIKLIINAGGKAKAFAVPVYVGDMEDLQKSKSHKKIKVMKAKESIE